MCSGVGGYRFDLTDVELLLPIPAIGAEEPSPGDAVVHAGYIWSKKPGLSPEPVVTDEHRWSIFWIGAAGAGFA